VSAFVEPSTCSAMSSRGGVVESQS